MTKVKKIIGDIMEGGAELLKDSAKQIGETVSPVKMLEQAIGQKPLQDDEFTKYLKTLGGELTAEQIEEKKKEFEAKGQGEMEEARKVLHQALPDHLKPRSKIQKLNTFEEAKQEEERKKAMQIEAQKKQPKTIALPQGKVTGVLGGRKKHKASDFEMGKNIKVG